MTNFFGEYEVTLDAKGRFLLPAGLKKQMQEGESSFIINRGFEGCLTLYTQKGWEPISNKIGGLNEFDPEARKFQRDFLRGATIVEPDAAGRLLLPPSLKEYAGLAKDIVLVAVMNKIEIWDVVKYKQHFENSTSDDLSELAMKVMGAKTTASN